MKKERICPHCKADLNICGVSIEAVNHYSIEEDALILVSVTNMPYDSSDVVCGECSGIIDIELIEDVVEEVKF